MLAKENAQGFFSVLSVCEYVCCSWSVCREQCEKCCGNSDETALRHDSVAAEVLIRMGGRDQLFFSRLGVQCN